MSRAAGKLLEDYRVALCPALYHQMALYHQIGKGFGPGRLRGGAPRAEVGRGQRVSRRSKKVR
jgi:hypothetical protein